MKNVKLLDNSEREAVREIFETEFDSALPDESQANIAAIVERGEILAFVASEILIRCGLLYVKPALRNTPKSASLTRALTRYLIQHIPEGSSCVCIATDKKQEAYFKRLGMREEKGKVYRIDL